MPTYAYVCQNCGHEFEQFQSITAKPLQKCPRCSKRRLKRLIGSGAGIIFKGSGFYGTDYRSESYKKGEKESKPQEDKKDKKAAEKKNIKKDQKTSTKNDTKSGN
jgi:putative FmdB family regulatory protein